MCFCHLWTQKMNQTLGLLNGFLTKLDILNKRVFANNGLLKSTAFLTYFILLSKLVPDYVTKLQVLLIALPKHQFWIPSSLYPLIEPRFLSLIDLQLQCSAIRYAHSWTVLSGNFAKTMACCEFDTVLQIMDKQAKSKHALNLLILLNFNSDEY